MARESALDRLTVYGIYYTDMLFLCCHASARWNKGMWENRDRCDDPWKDQGALLMFYLHTPVFTVSSVFS